MDRLYFGISVAAGFIGWFTIFTTLIWPKLKTQPKAQILKSLTAAHLFRYFGTVFLIVGLVVHELPAEFANTAAFGDLITVLLAYIAFITLQRSRDTSRLFSVWLFNVFGAIDLLLALTLGSLLVNPADLGFAYVIPTFYVPMLLVTHFYAFKTLRRP
jgi:hypothetical protein